jgi:hypothetical protein
VVRVAERYTFARCVAALPEGVDVVRLHSVVRRAATGHGAASARLRQRAAAGSPSRQPEVKPSIAVTTDSEENAAEAFAAAKQAWDVLLRGARGVEQRES